MGVRITDTTLRDAHQSLLATRMRTLLCHSERRPRPHGDATLAAKESGAGQTAALVGTAGKPWA